MGSSSEAIEKPSFKTLYYGGITAGQLWETKWLEYVCSCISLRSIPTLDLGVLLVASVDGFNQDLSPLIQFLREQSRNSVVGLLHLSDEWFKVPHTELYEPCGFVIRIGHASATFPSKVLTVPIGLSAEFMNLLEAEPLTVKSPFQRYWTWSFVGQIDLKPTREAMLQHMQRIPNAKIYVGSTEWHKSNSSIPKAEYLRILSESVFAPCPRGFSAEGDASVDGFRTWEAIEMGAIPIVDSTYYQRSFNAPFPIVSESWQEAPSIVSSLMANPEALQALQIKIAYWWHQLKNQLPAQVLNHIQHHVEKREGMGNL